LLLSLCLFLVIGAEGPTARGQDAAPDPTDMQERALDVYLDGMPTKEIYIKEQIPFVNYVRDVRQADLYILGTSRSTGSGDTEYTLTFFGQKAYTGIDDTLTCFCRNLDTEEQCRSELVRIMKMGLVRYVSRTPQADGIRITHVGVTKSAGIKDRWDYWVFNIGASGYISGEESYKTTYYSTSVSADRVTPALKLNFGFSYSFSETRYEYLNLDYTDESKRGSFDGLIAKSINDHWSYGLFFSSSQSVYGNMDRSWEAAPAIEYSIFPYEETSRRDFRLVYRAGYRYNDYEEETIYFETEESLYYSQFSLEFDMKTFWGTFSSYAIASHYFHDFDLNRLSIDASLSLRVTEGLSFGISGYYSAIHDQITLARGGATEEDVLLRRKELSTQYNYFFRLGFTYRFGSRYSNVINPRF
jgi:hypothetical protein